MNASIKRLSQSGLLRAQSNLLKEMRLRGRLEAVGISPRQAYLPVTGACEEFLVSGVRYVFPVQLGEYTRGIATSYAAPVFENQISVGNDPIPVWPYAEGTHNCRY